MTTGRRMLRGAALGVLAAAIVGIPVAAFALALSPPAPIGIVDGRVLVWSDYPAAADAPGADVVGTAEADADWAALRDELRETLRSGWGLEAGGGASAFIARERNGYGGDSLLTDLQPEPLSTDGLPQADERRALLADLSAVTERHGLGPLVLLQDVPGSGESREHHEPDELRWSTWTAHADGAGGRLSVTLLDRDGEPALDADEHGLRIEFVRAAVADDDRAAFRAALEPFRGLEPPPATR